MLFKTTRSLDMILIAHEDLVHFTLHFTMLTEDYLWLYEQYE